MKNNYENIMKKNRMDWNGFKKLVAHTAGRKATCKNNKVFITPIR